MGDQRIAKRGNVEMKEMEVEEEKERNEDGGEREWKGVERKTQYGGKD